jgi:hypothetical protein
MRTLKLLALPVFAVLLSACVMQFRNAYASNDLSLLRDWLMPDSLLYSLWWGGLKHLSSRPLLYTVSVYLLLAASWVWWFRRPKISSAAAVFLFTFMGGSTASIFTWYLLGGYIGHS